MKRIIIRSALGLLYVLLLVLMLVTGKRHTILIDNKADPNGAFGAINGMSVQIDALEAAEYYPGDRDKAVVKGQRHRIRVELFDDEKVIERDFRIPLNQDMVLLSVPKMLAGIEPFIEPFTVQLEQASMDQTAAQNERHQQFGSDAEGLPLDMNTPAQPAPAANP
ncbi:DUF6672 family protein [Gracilinema caldarium]|uniref:Uncharacterized protein n=1 Tax=Gracilinema caldarium (strain ATCC 51460 / DSM 7334 / H1) TaxID=744872 RepID=F8F050_GRAC1|nr:DUF6672 family protein [Gracilinema caldarium]AEJ18703.1 hypothetical protein Spica_0543 [Gracilinema caldarium DSM 7334]